MKWYICTSFDVIFVKMDGKPKMGYIARKRKQQQATSEQSTDEYGLWLLTSGLVKQTATALDKSLCTTRDLQKNKEVIEVLNSMHSLLIANPMLAQDIAMVYQTSMRSNYDKLLRQSTPVAPKKKQKA